jgi:hypothetical protein
LVKKFPYKVAVVSWVDSEHHSDWDNLSEVLESQGSLECLSAGFIIADKEDRIVLATSISADADENEEQVSAYITIPKRAILEVKELKYKAPVKKKIIGIQEQQ